MSNEIGKKPLSRRSFLGMAALGVGGTLLAACTPPPVPGAPAASGAQAPSTAKAPIIYWSMFGLDEAEQAQTQVERFNQETEQNAIFMSIGWGNVVQKAQVAIQGGSPPDLVSLWSQAYTWGPRGLLLPLEDYAARDGWTGKGWSKPAWDSLWSENHLWGTGHTLNMFALHINKGLYEKAGFDVKQPPKDIAALDEMAAKLTTQDANGNLTELGFLPWQNANLWHWGWAHGANFYDEKNDKVLANSDEHILQTLEWFVSYAKKYGIDNIDRFRSGFGKATMSPDDPWYVGKVAAQIDGSWKRSWIPRFAPKLEYIVAKTPTAPGVDPISLVEIGAMFNVPKGAKNPEGAWALAKEFASKRSQIEFGKLVGDIPPLIEAARDPEFLNAYPYNEEFIQLAETGGRAWPRIPVLELYQQEMDRLVDQVVHDKVQPQAGLDALTQKVQKELDDFRKQTKK